MASRSIVRTLNDVFRGYRGYLIALALAGVASALIDGFTIAAIIPIVSFLVSPDGALPTGAVTNLFVSLFGLVGVPFQFRYLIVLIAILLFLRLTVQAIFGALRARVSAKFFATEVRTLHRLTLDASWPYMAKQKGGHVQNAIMWDVRRASDLLDTVVQLAQSGSGLLIYSVVALGISPTITLITFVAGLAFLFFLRPLLRRTRGFSESMRQSESELTQRVGEHVAGFKLLQAADASAGAISATEPYIARMEHALSRSIFAGSLGNIFVQPFGFLFAMGLFGFLYFTGNFQIAQFAASLYLIQKIFVYMESANSAQSVMLRSIPFAEHMLAYKADLKRAAERDQANGKEFTFSDAIRFTDVSFSYREDATALTNITFSIPKGSFTGIVGPSGAGKTSLVDLLLRLFVPDSGSIRVDGVPADAIRLSSWRTRVGYVPQDAFLIHGTIRENVRFYDESISDTAIEEALALAAFDVASLPQGAETVVGDRGVALSGGQRQRVALARALARKPEVLVLDEFTSALDAETATRIHEVIRGLSGQLTLIVIAHRVSSILGADQVLVVEGGRIVETGKPEEMLARPDSYLARVAKVQGIGN